MGVHLAPLCFKNFCLLKQRKDLGFVELRFLELFLLEGDDEVLAVRDAALLDLWWELNFEDWLLFEEKLKVGNVFLVKRGGVKKRSLRGEPELVL